MSSRTATRGGPAAEGARGPVTEERAPRASNPPRAAATPPSPAGNPASFITVLVTPKLTFSLQRKSEWREAADIPQDALRQAFLSRFPVRFDADKLSFRCAQPAVDLTSTERLVYRIAADGTPDDERVLLQILSALDKAYSAKYERQLEEARADLLSASLSFQDVADEVRAGQEACSKKWEREVRSMKEQLSTNQKRLFLLEREKESLQKGATATEEAASRLRRSVSGLTEENAALRTRQGELEEQLGTLREAVATLVDGHAAGGGGVPARPARFGVRSHEVACQAGGDAEMEAAEAANRVAIERWQQQLSAMSDWLRTGAALLQPPVRATPLAPHYPAPTCAPPASASSRLITVAPPPTTLMGASPPGAPPPAESSGGTEGAETDDSHEATDDPSAEPSSIC